MAGVPDDFADRMDRRIGVHALEKSDLVYHRRQSWINLAHPRTALAVLFEIKHRRQDLAVLHRFFGIKTLQIIITENLRGLFAGPLLELRFVIKCLEMTRPPAHEHHDHILRARPMMPWSRQQRPLRLQRQHLVQRQPTQTQLPKKLSAIDVQ